MTEGVRIEPYCPDDLDELMAIEVVSFAIPWSRNSYAELAAVESVTVWIARLGGELVGYMLLQQVVDEMELHTFAVKESYRRQGIGRMLLDHMVAEARRLHSKHIYLQVRPSNTAAGTLYRKMGFKAVGLRRRYYHDNGENAIVMSLEMDPGSRIA